MSKISSPSRRSGPARSGGFNAPRRVAGFLVSLKSLLWPELGLPMVPPRTLPEPKGGYFRTLPGMPRAADARSSPTQASTPGAMPAPVPPPDSLEAHPLRRVAGSAGRWKKRLDEARRNWPLATVDELVATDGHLQKLADLVQLRYGVSREAAELQVRQFLGSHDAGV